MSQIPKKHEKTEDHKPRISVVCEECGYTYNEEETRSLLREVIEISINAKLEEMRKTHDITPKRSHNS